MKILENSLKSFENIVAAMFLIKNMLMPSEFNRKACGKEKTTAGTKARSLKVAWFYEKDAGCMTKLMPDLAPANPTQPDPRPTRPDPRPTRPDPRPTRPDPRTTRPDLCSIQARLRPEPCPPKTARDCLLTAIS